MALNLTNLFTALGRAGRNIYIINGAQALQPTPFNQLSGFAYINPAWIANLTQGYDSAIRISSSGEAPWVQASQQILLQMVAAENPAYGTSLSSALSFLYNEMVAQSETVEECTITDATVADPTNVGSGSIFVTTTRGDGVSLQNTVAEESTLLITADSYTGGSTVGQEPWRWSGAPNVSSLATGIGVGLWDWDWPQGSGASASGNAIKASSYNNTAANYLTNGDFATWTGSPAEASYWNLETGTWGTSIEQNSTDQLGGDYCVQFNLGATLNCLEQQFDTTTVTGVGAGTPAALTAYRGYAVNLFLRAAGVISGGVLTVSLVDSTGTTINDQSGNPQDQTLALTGLSTSWTGYPFPLRLPVVLPADGIVRLRIKITTALAGANLLMDEVAFCQPTSLYRGGPSIAVFSNPAAPFEAAPDPDGWTITFTNDRASALYGATWQTFINRLFQAPDLILPYDSPGTILDTLITGA